MNIPTIPAKASGDTFTLSNWNSIKDAINNGVVTQCAARLERTTDQTVAANTSTAVTFQNVAYDTDSMSDLVNHPTRLTVQTAGIFTIKAALELQGATGGNVSLEVHLNGGANQIARVDRAAKGGSSADWISVSTDYQLAVGDYVELFGSTGTGSTKFLVAVQQAAPVLSVARV